MGMIEKLEILKKISLVNRYVNMNKPKYIVIHQSYNKMSAKEHAYNAYNINLGVSSQFYIDNKEIWQSVELEDSALHIQDGYSYGKWQTDATMFNTICIVCCSDENYNIESNTERLLYKLVEALITDLDINPDNVIRHYDVSGKNCPISWRNNNWEKFWNFKRKINSNKVNVSYTGNSISAVYKDITDKNIADTVNVNNANMTEFKAIYRNSKPKKDTNVKQVSDKDGIFTPYESIPLFKYPSNDKNDIVDYFEKGESVSFDSQYFGNGYLWISYLSHNGHRKYLPIQEINKDNTAEELKGKLEHTVITNNLDIYPEGYDTGICDKEIEEGTFVSRDFLRVRTEPSVYSPHIMTIQPVQSFDFDMIVRGNSFIWLSFLHQNGKRVYVAVQTFDNDKGVTSDLKGFFVSNTILNKESM